MLLLLSLTGVIRFFWDASNFKREFAIFFMWVLPVIGLVLGIVDKKGIFKTFALVGNSLIVFVTIVIPYASTLFWNEP